MLEKPRAMGTVAASVISHDLPSGESTETELRRRRPRVEARREQPHQRHVGLKHGLVEFGLGPGPDTLDREVAERAAVLSPLMREEDEATASLLGILWEAALGQPALASFLDQNWLEGLGRSAAAHFTAVVETLSKRNLLNVEPKLAASTAPTGVRAPHCWSQ